MRIVWVLLLAQICATACAPVFEVELPRATDRAQALDYLQDSSQVRDFFVWPVKIRTYESIGSDKSIVSRVVHQINTDLAGYVILQDYVLSPTISINIYEGDVNRAISNFAQQSDLPSQWKDSISNRDFGDAFPCTFSRFTSRETWAAGGFFLVDRTRLGSDEAVESCLRAGLDYINGFPAHSRLQYEDFPLETVRRAIIFAVLECSKDGAVERSRDGYSPLPSMDCVVDWLSKPEL